VQGRLAQVLRDPTTLKLSVSSARFVVEVDIAGVEGERDGSRLARGVVTRWKSRSRGTGCEMLATGSWM
jgi:hypothetical protein